jgi:Acetyltransferase (GNAT) domain
MSEGYTVEPLTPELFPQLAPLMADAFGDNPPTGLFEWKYLRNPAGPAIGHVARSTTGELAAFYGMIPERFRWGQSEHRIYQSCDTMTHSRHRRKGLFQLLAQETYALARSADPGFFAFGFSGATSTPGFYKMGWTSPFEVPHRFKPRLLAKLGSGSGPEKLTTLPETLPDLMRQREATRTHSRVFYPEFVEWRLSTPATDYACLIDDGAYAVFRQGAGFVYLLDFWEAGRGAGRGVMRALNREASVPGSKGLLTACQAGGDLDQQLRRYSFLANPFRRGPASHRTPLIVYGTPPVPAAATAQGWQVTSIDFDSL